MGEIARGLEPIPLFTDTGCRMGHYAARKQTPPPFRPPIHMDYSGRDAPWRRCFCGDGEPWDCGGAGCARRVGALRLHGEPAPTHLHRHAGRASSQVLARWAGFFFRAATDTVGGEAHGAFAAQKGWAPTSTVSGKPTARSEPWGCTTATTRRTMQTRFTLGQGQRHGGVGGRAGQSEQPLWSSA